MKGYFVVFEGQDGSGKGTVLDMVAAKLRHTQARRVFCTREPYMPELGFMSHPGAQASAKSGMTFCIDRLQHLVQVVSKELFSGSIVLCDRFCMSTAIYQDDGFMSRGESGKEACIERMCRLQRVFAVPDMTVWISLDNPVTAAMRVVARDRLVGGMVKKEVETARRLHGLYKAVFPYVINGIQINNDDEPGHAAHRAAYSIIQALHRNISV